MTAKAAGMASSKSRAFTYISWLAQGKAGQAILSAMTRDDTDRNVSDLFTQSR